MMDYLARRSVGHWDKAIRELASKSLAILTETDPEYVFEKILPGLVCVVDSTET